MTIINDYLKLTKEYIEIYGEKTLLLMQVGSFFECYALVQKDGTYSGSHIQEFADINDMTISRKNICVSGLSVVMAGFGLPQLEKYIKKLQEQGYTIVVYTQDTPSKNTTRSLSCIYSPGTFFSNDSQELSNNTTTIWIHYSQANKVIKEQITIGLANIDIYTGKTSIYEFSNEYHNSPCTYDELEKYIAVYKPSEVIIISNLDDTIIDNIIQYANITSRQIHRIDTRNKITEYEKEALNVEKQKYQEGILKKFFAHEDGIISEYYNYCIATQSLCFLLEFIYKHNPNLVTKIEKPVIENYGDKLILANHSLKQLNIISDNRHSGKLGSVCTFLNNCVTTIGKRQFNYNLLNPITNIEILNTSYNITEHVLKENKWELIRNSLNNVRDLEKIKRKLIMNKISPKDFYNLSINLSTLKDLFKEIKKDSILLQYINNYIDCDFEKTCKKLIDYMKKNLDLTKCRYLDDVNNEKLSSLSLENLTFINKNIIKELDEKTKICMDSRELFEAIRKYFSDELKIYEKSSKTNDFIKIHETPKMDAVLIGTKRRVMILKGILDKLLTNNQFTVELKYISKYSGLEETFLLNLSYLEYKIHGGNQSNLIITSNQICEITRNIQSSKDNLINEIVNNYKIIISDFLTLQECHTKTSDLDNIIKLVGLTDNLQCKCYIAQKYNYCRPIIEKREKSYINCEKIRHCLIEQFNSKELYVTNNLELGKEKDGILLYGTNAVGKTSLIKSLGIALIMAQSGLYVPCSSFIYWPYNYIFTRILGNDNIFKGLSTFAVEMSELRTILKQSNKNSLILGDELCSGTESTSALSIFTAGLEQLHYKKASFIFATHFHEIVNYEEIEILDRLKLYHMTVIYNKAKNQLIYDRKLKEGPGENMYGLEVCKSLDLPYSFLERAHSLRLKYTGKSGVLSNSSSHFNSQKLRDNCEICKKNIGTEIHHLQYQKNAINGIINKEFHKNHPANLINICEECHEKIHKSNIQHKIVKTSDGYEIMKL